MVFQDNPGWPFPPQLKWINSQISDCGMDSTEVPPADQRQITSTNTCFIHHCPNQSEHHATLPNIILNYPLVFKIGVLRQEFYAGCPSLRNPVQMNHKPTTHWFHGTVIGEKTYLISRSAILHHGSSLSTNFCSLHLLVTEHIFSYCTPTLVYL
jgi:hypothetical protein